jgi:hypothetical protein
MLTAKLLTENLSATQKSITKLYRKKFLFLLQVFFLFKNLMQRPIALIKIWALINNISTFF